jgi:Domain of unknown function (DUF4410)
VNITIRMLVAGVLWLFSALPILAQPDVTASKADEQYGFRIHTPNSNWVFHDPDDFNVRALLKSARELIFIRLWTLDNLDEMQDDKFLEDFKYRYSKLRFDTTRSSGLINGRRWHTLTGKAKDRRFSLQFNFERERVFLLEYEAPSPEMFQEYKADRDAVLAKLEFGATPVKSFSQFEALELEFVPVERAKMKPDDVSNITEEIIKRLKPTDFREIRPTRTQTSDKTLLLSIRVRKFERGSRAQRYAIGYGAGQTVLDGDLIFTDKETGKVLYIHRMSYKTTGGFLGGSSYKGAVEDIVKVIQAKKRM